MNPAAPTAAGSASGARPAHDASRAITADREESKFLLDRAALAAFLRSVERHVPRHRFVGEGANRLPDPEHYVSTIYFDSASHAQLRAALRDRDHNVKIRAREYYDLHPSLAELATRPDQLVSYRPWVWFEVKRRVGGRTQKHRFGLPKREVPDFFRGEHVAFGGSAEHQPELRSIVDFMRSLHEPLLPSCLVNYHRIAFQDAAGRLRITVDLDVSFYAVPPDVWSRAEPLTRASLGAPVEREPSVLIEVKSTGEPPDWLSASLDVLGAAPSAYSKFARGGQAVHGIR